MKESELTAALTILEQADQSCNNHDIPGARLHIGILKLLLNSFLPEAVVLPFREVSDGGF